MAQIIPHEELELDLGSRVCVLVDGTFHEGEVVRCGNTRDWGHMISDSTGERIAFTTDEDGYKQLS